MSGWAATAFSKGLEMASGALEYASQLKEQEPAAAEETATEGEFDLDAQRAAARANAEKFAASLTPEEAAIYGAKCQVAASGVAPDDGEEDDGEADFTMGGEDAGTLLGDY
eukprot:TRINITY_DN53416_c0_g1_i1.p1 TRINITY_DN53416_c0_g1~~TRINITY_DN53416_c0_g1_i1.p1  ORF type:complete len:111 (+),score=36.76 TRINITY_DN53416_c0_g1_i1:100-432(+)